MHAAFTGVVLHMGTNPSDWIKPQDARIKSVEKQRTLRRLCVKGSGEVVATSLFDAALSVFQFMNMLNLNHLEFSN